VENTQANPLYLEASRPIPVRLKDLLGRMTLEEKLFQLTSYWFHDLRNGQDLSHDRMQVLLGKGIGQISRITFCVNIPAWGSRPSFMKNAAPDTWGWGDRSSHR
jgi:hypothetical protein